MHGKATAVYRAAMARHRIAWQSKAKQRQSYVMWCYESHSNGTVLLCSAKQQLCNARRQQSVIRAQHSDSTSKRSRASPGQGEVPHSKAKAAQGLVEPGRARHSNGSVKYRTAMASYGRATHGRAVAGRHTVQQWRNEAWPIKAKAKHSRALARSNTAMQRQGKVTHCLSKQRRREA